VSNIPYEHLSFQLGKKRYHSNGAPFNSEVLAMAPSGGGSKQASMERLSVHESKRKKEKKKKEHQAPNLTDQHRWLFGLTRTACLA
jgi:hypothetical protein